MPATDRRQRGGVTLVLAKLVAATGITRSMPEESQTTQTRPSRCLTVTPTRGKVRP
jgi:hypothetical protein